MAEIGEEKPKEKSDVIEIPVGKLFKQVRENPWMIVSFVLGFLLIAILVFGGGISKSKVVSETQAKESVMNFLELNVGEDIQFQSIERDRELYRLIVVYQGQEVPIYATLDGQNLVSEVIPINSVIALSDSPQQDYPDEIEPSF